jgi:hypothetical protein
VALLHDRGQLLDEVGGIVEDERLGARAFERAFEAVKVIRNEHSYDEGHHGRSIDRRAFGRLRAERSQDQAAGLGAAG